MKALVILSLAAAAMRCVAADVNEDVSVRRLADLTPGPSSTTFFNLVSEAERAFFVAQIEDDNGELTFPIYSTNGKDSPQMLQVPTTLYIVPFDLYPLNDHQVLFGAADEAHGTELWLGDTTISTTTSNNSQAVLVKDINPGPGSFIDYDFILPELSKTGGGAAATERTAYYFRALTGNEEDPEQVQLYRSDGTTSGTQAVTDPDTSSRRILHNRHTVQGLEDRVFYFVNNTEDQSIEMWICGNSPPQEQSDFSLLLVLDEEISSGGIINVLPQALNNKIAIVPFSVDDDIYDLNYVHENYLWTIDHESGTQTKLTKYGSARPPGIGVSARIGNAQAVFFETNPISSVLVVTDGTVAGTREIQQLGSGGECYALFAELPDNRAMIIHQCYSTTAIADAINANDDDVDLYCSWPPTAIDIWITDGTASGTVRTMSMPYAALIGHAYPLSDGRVALSLRDTRECHEGNTKETYYEIWVTNGSLEGSTMVHRSAVASENDDDVILDWNTFVPVGNDRLVFFGHDADHGQEPWVLTYQPSLIDISSTSAAVMVTDTAYAAMLCTLLYLPIVLFML